MVQQMVPNSGFSALTTDETGTAGQVAGMGVIAEASARSTNSIASHASKRVPVAAMECNTAVSDSVAVKNGSACPTATNVARATLHSDPTLLRRTKNKR
jgi:hypothetical protein